MRLRNLVVLAFAFSCGGDLSKSGEQPADFVVQEEAQQHHSRVCGDAMPGFARCHALIRTNAAGKITPSVVPSGFSPADLASAYNLPASGGQGQWVAVVTAFDAPNAEADLAVYRAQFGLPPCTSSAGCFRKVGQQGLSSLLPAPNATWAQDTTLDIQMVSAVCPSCHILLVEANSTSSVDLRAAVSEAVLLGANVVSNSYGGLESAADPSTDGSYNRAGVLMVASAGDGGYEVLYPAASPHVLAVGGTTLTRTTSGRGWTESAWSTSTTFGTSSGCSAFEPKPSWQLDIGCSRRTVADVSAVADPATGVAVYNSALGGWVVTGGTSASAPIVAAAFALTGHSAATPQYPYANPGLFYDVSSGATASCSPVYLCTAIPGYDGPTGIGTPNGRAIVAGAEFSISAGQTINLHSGTTGTATISTAITGGSAESVNLTAASSLAGVTVALSPAVVSSGGSATLTATAAITTAAFSVATVTITGTAASGSHTTTLTVRIVPPDVVLSNGVAVTGLAGPTSSQQFFSFNVPAGQGSLIFQMSGGTGDADMFVKFGARPTTSDFDCRPFVNGNTETCTFNNPAAGTWYVMLQGFSAFAGVTLKATYAITPADPTPVLTNGVAVTGLSGAATSQQFFKLPVTGASALLTFAIRGGTGDADLYVRRGARPTTAVYDCRPFLNGNNETCSIANPVAGDYYVLINGFTAYSGVSLTGTF